MSVFRCKPGKYSLQTIRSWEFVGLEEGEKSKKLKKDDFWFKARYGKEVIVGLLDSAKCYPVLITSKQIIDIYIYIYIL